MCLFGSARLPACLKRRTVETLLRCESSAIITTTNGVLTHVRSTQALYEVGGASIRAKFALDSNAREAKVGAWALLVKSETTPDYYVAIANVRAQAENVFDLEAELIVFAQPQKAIGKDNYVYFLQDEDLRTLFPRRGGPIDVKMVEYLGPNETVACEGPWLRDRVCLLCRGADIRWARGNPPRKNARL